MSKRRHYYQKGQDKSGVKKSSQRDCSFCDCCFQGITDLIVIIIILRFLSNYSQ